MPVMNNINPNKEKKTMKHMKLLILAGAILLGGCAHQALTAPCPNYGSSCAQTPINSWDTHY